MLAISNLREVGYDEAPTVLILGEDWGAAMAEAARAVDARVVDSVPLREAEARLDLQVDVDAVILILHHDEGAATDRLLDRLEAAAREGRYRSVVTLPAALIDMAAARTSHADVTLLADPKPIDCAAAVAIACARQAGRQRLHDRSENGGTQRLLELSEEVGRLARQLASLTGQANEPEALPATAAIDPAPAELEVSARAIRTVIRARRAREQFFRSDLFADPAWDILLDLAAARKEGRGVSVSSLCIAAAVPPTTALRWIKALAEEGLLLRHADPSDGRRVFISLAEHAAMAIDACLATMIRITRDI